MNLLQNFLINIIENVKRKSSELVLLMSGLIPRNIFKLHARKVYTKYEKICVSENPLENYPRKKKSWVKLSKISLLFQKTCSDLSGFIQGHLSVFISPTKTESGRRRKFLKLLHVVQRYICHVFVSLWHPIFKRKNKVADQTKHAAVVITDGEVYVATRR